jgi:hypothetical protein
VGDITRALKGHLVLVASDASDHTWRRAKSYVAGTNQQAIRVKYTKEELGMVVGRQSLAIAAITDPALALALVNSLEEPEKYKAAAEVLAEKVAKAKQRQSEAKAHQRNVRKGKVKK